MKRVTAIVLTYNRLNFLKQIIPALKNQSYKIENIIVINNSSTDGTKEWLESQDNITVYEQANLGSSGGQYTGFLKAKETNPDFIWTMDDDVCPDLTCLEELMKYANENTIVAPLRYFLDGKPFFNDAISYNLTNPLRSIWNEIYSENKFENEEVTDAVGITFEGPLMPANLIDKIGLPQKNFFIFADDTEYFIRAKKSNYHIKVVKKAKLNRLLPYVKSGKGFNWKHYYFIRNIIAIDVLHGTKIVRLFRPFGYLLIWLLRARNIKEISTVFKAFKDGYFYKSIN